MIAIVSSNAQERVAFSAMLEARSWPWAECDSVQAFKRLLRQVQPHIVVMRHRLKDGYSDDLFAELETAALSGLTRNIVLIDASVRADQEARQVRLGADYVHRDPVRCDVLLEYISKYRALAGARSATSPETGPRSFEFAGATVYFPERRIEHGRKSRMLTLREYQLLDRLAEAQGRVVTYETLYADILGRKFRGETSNMRVLLGKLDASLQSVGIRLRRAVSVIPKAGYRYDPPQRS